MSRGPPRRSGRRSTATVGLALLLGVALVVGAIPASSFSTAVVPRDASLGVATDENGLLGIDVTDSVSKDAQDVALVTLRNRFERPLSVTVALVNASDGILIGPDGDTGNVVSFELGTVGSAATATVNVTVDANPNSQLAVDITAEGNGVSVSAPDRRTNVTPKGGNCPPNGRGPPRCR